jgi:hypothetical protein
MFQRYFHCIHMVGLISKRKPPMAMAKASSSELSDLLIGIGFIIVIALVAWATR